MESNQNLDLADFDRLISLAKRPNAQQILKGLKERYEITFKPRPQPVSHKKFDNIDEANLKEVNAPKKPKMEIIADLKDPDFDYEPEEYNYKLLKKYLINTKTQINESALGHKLKILSDYSWNQTDTHIEFSINLPNITSEDLESLKCELTVGKKTVDFLVTNFKQENYRFKVKDLYEDVILESSSVNFTKGKISLRIKKAFNLPWKMFSKKQPKFNPEMLNPEPKDKQNPLNNIFGMVRKLYDTGDDEMKQMFAQSWAKKDEQYKAQLKK